MKKKKFSFQNNKNTKCNLNVEYECERERECRNKSPYEYEIIMKKKHFIYIVRYKSFCLLVSKLKERKEKKSERARGGG